MRYVDACRSQSWHLMLSEIKEDGEVLEEKPYVYRCRSWRHVGECSHHKGACDFARIAQAISKYNGWVYCVLTFNQSEWWDWKEQYTLAGSYWSAMRLRLVRQYGKFPYIQTWERHVKQGIHVNLLLSSEGIKKGCYQALKPGFDEERWFNDDIEQAATGVGFGRIHWAEPMGDYDSGSMAGYFVKLANELVGADQKSQVPFDAPPHFRRLRASRGLLPKAAEKSMTGRIVFRPPPACACDFEKKEVGLT